MNALLSPLKELADYEEIIKNRNKEKQRQNNVREYQRKFLNKKMKRGK